MKSIKYNKQRCASLITFKPDAKCGKSSVDNSSRISDTISTVAVDQARSNRGHDTTLKTGRRKSTLPSNLKHESLPSYGMQSNKLVTRDDDAEITFRATLQTIHRETLRYLQTLGRAASEGRAVDEANNFLRWLQFSGVLRLLEVNTSINPAYKALRAKCDDVQEICKPHLQGRNMPATPCQARIDEVSDKVDMILSYLAKPITPSNKHAAYVVQAPMLANAGGAS